MAYNVIAHGLLNVNNYVNIGKTPSPVYPENNAELNLRIQASFPNWLNTQIFASVNKIETTDSIDTMF